MTVLPPTSSRSDFVKVSGFASPPATPVRVTVIVFEKVVRLVLRSPVMTGFLSASLITRVGSWDITGMAPTKSRIAIHKFDLRIFGLLERSDQRIGRKVNCALSMTRTLHDMGKRRQFSRSQSGPYMC